MKRVVLVRGFIPGHRDSVITRIAWDFASLEDALTYMDGRDFHPELEFFG